MSGVWVGRLDPPWPNRLGWREAKCGHCGHAMWLPPHAPDDVRPACNRGCMWALALGKGK